MLKPCGHRVLVKPKEVEEQSAGGIILTSSEREKKLEKAGICEGHIVAIGPTAWQAYDKSYVKDEIGTYTKEIKGRPWASIGDRVYYSQYGGKYIVDPVTEEEFVLMNDDDIAAVITED